MAEVDTKERTWNFVRIPVPHITKETKPKTSDYGDNFDVELVEEKIINGKDDRYKIESTELFPHNCIAKIFMTFQDTRFIGTGFLSSGFRFITAAHNIRDLRTGLGWADKVQLYFGLNTRSSLKSEECIELKGRHFTIHPNHKKATDEFDFAWCNLGDHWKILPSEHFSIDESLTISSRPSYRICGK
jgi:hypothetical protein